MLGVTSADADEVVFKALSDAFNSIGLKVYEEVRPTDAIAKEGKSFVIFYGNDIRTGAPRRHRPLSGWQDASVYASFGVFVGAESVKVKKGMVKLVRQTLLNLRTDFMSDIMETGAMNSYSDTDGTVKPVKYTWYGTFQCLVDRS